METAQSQADVRRVYTGGFGGPAVSALVWLAAAVTADAAGTERAAAVLFIGGALFIFPVNLLVNRFLSGQADLPGGHPMRGLAIQTAAGMAVVLLALWVTVPVAPGVFFPLAMVVVGAHYLPFSHLYGEPAFLVAGAVQCVAGLLLLVIDAPDSLGAYLMAGLLAVMSVVLLVRHRRRSLHPPR